MGVNPWEQAALTPVDVPSNAKQRPHSGEELKQMRERLMKAMEESLAASEKARATAEKPPQRNITIKNLNPLIAVAAEEITAEQLRDLIYDIRDEWCAETGEWDGNKMPVPVLAEKLIEKTRIHRKAVLDQ
jgi:hypothetical protein